MGRRSHKCVLACVWGALLFYPAAQGIELRKPLGCWGRLLEAARVIWYRPSVPDPIAAPEHFALDGIRLRQALNWVRMRPMGPTPLLQERLRTAGNSVFNIGLRGRSVLAIRPGGTGALSRFLSDDIAKYIPTLTQPEFVHRVGERAAERLFPRAEPGIPLSLDEATSGSMLAPAWFEIEAARLWQQYIHGEYDDCLGYFIVPEHRLVAMEVLDGMISAGTHLALLRQRGIPKWVDPSFVENSERVFAHSAHTILRELEFFVGILDGIGSEDAPVERLAGSAFEVYADSFGGAERAAMLVQANPAARWLRVRLMGGVFIAPIDPQSKNDQVQLDYLLSRMTDRLQMLREVVQLHAVPIEEPVFPWPI